MEENSPEAKCKKVVTGHEVLAMLREHENYVAKVANVIGYMLYVI